MTITEAKRIVREYYENEHASTEEEFVFTEALRFLVEETKDPDYMNELGAFYYGKKQFDLALKYYELAAEYGNRYATSNLGYIWYYGRTGKRDFEKAFRCFEKAAEMGDLIAAYKVADMYRNGYYVEKNPEKYKEIIEELYPQVENAQYTNEPLPEVFTRLAKIRSEEGNTDEALSLYDRARDFLAFRIMHNPFFGNLNIMKWMIDDIYALREIDRDNLDLYDLYYLLKAPAKVFFRYGNKQYEVESVEEDGACAIRFGDKWYRSIDDFFAKAEIERELLTALYEDLYGFKEVER